MNQKLEIERKEMNLQTTVTEELYAQLPQGLQQAYQKANDGSYVLSLSPRSESPVEKMIAARRAQQAGDAVHAQAVVTEVKGAGLPEDRVVPILERSRAVVNPDGTVTVRLFLDEGRSIEAPSSRAGVFHKDLAEHLDEIKVEIAEEQARQKLPPQRSDDLIEDRIVNGVRVTRRRDGGTKIDGFTADEFCRLSPATQISYGRLVSPPPKPAKSSRTNFPGLRDGSKGAA